MQDKSENYLEFSERTESLGRVLSLNLNDLPPRIGISPAMFYAHRTGKNRISEKTWRKLRAAEVSAGIMARDDADVRAHKTDIDKLTGEARKLMTADHMAWLHYLAMEALLDMALKNRRPLDDPEEEADYRALHREFMTKRERGRAAIIHMRDATKAVGQLLLLNATNAHRAALNTELDELTRQAEANLAARKKSGSRDLGGAAQG